MNPVHRGQIIESGFTRLELLMVTVVSHPGTRSRLAKPLQIKGFVNQV
jgi:hypothetical protein